MLKYQYFQITNSQSKITTEYSECIELLVLKQKQPMHFSLLQNSLPTEVQKPEVLSVRKESKKWKTRKKVDAANEYIALYHSV